MTSTLTTQDKPEVVKSKPCSGVFVFRYPPPARRFLDTVCYYLFLIPLSCLAVLSVLVTIPVLAIVYVYAAAKLLGKAVIRKIQGERCDQV